MIKIKIVVFILEREKKKISVLHT